MLLTVFGAITSSHAAALVRDIDFNNFTYSLRSGGIGPSRTITLDQGGYSSGFGSVEINDIYYSDINGDDIEDAVVVLTASGGGSGVSTHAFGFTERNGRVEEILYLLNFISIKPYRNGFRLVRANPSNTGSQICSSTNSIMRVNAVDVETYEWNGSAFVQVDSTTVRGQQACAFR